jgi:hypothetical protein
MADAIDAALDPEPTQRPSLATLSDAFASDVD